jgi:hypothetical protein
MNNTFKTFSLLSLVFFVQALSGQENFVMNRNVEFEGTWNFEKAEYSEKDDVHSDFSIKQTFTDVMDLSTLDEKFHYLIQQITIKNDIAEFLCPSGIYTGKYQIFNLKDSGDEAYAIITIGNPEEENMVYEGRILNAPGIQYRIKKTGNKTIAITREGTDLRNSKTIYGMVTCILKKID